MMLAAAGGVMGLIAGRWRTARWALIPGSCRDGGVHMDLA